MFFDLFNKKEEKKSHIPKYDPKLIGKFHKDHDAIRADIEKIQKAMDQGAIGTGIVKNALKHLRMRLLGHFMEEDIKLYWYMKDYYKEDENAFDIIKSFENSIKEIQNDVLHFFDYYARDDIPLDTEYEKKFKQIVSELSDRVASEEENLYTLYLK